MNERGHERQLSSVPRELRGEDVDLGLKQWSLILAYREIILGYHKFAMLMVRCCIMPEISDSAMSSFLGVQNVS